MSYLGIDIGTSSIKGLAVNEEGQIIASSRANYNFLTPNSGWVELEPDLIFLLVKKIIRQLSLKVRKIDPVSSISFSSVGTAFVPIDEKGNVIYNAISSLDTRSRSRIVFFEKCGVDNFDIYKITGQPKKIISLLHNLVWLKERFGKNFNKIFKFLSLKDYCIYRIGLEPVTDYTQASRTMLYDYKIRNWSEYIFNLIGIDIDVFPKIVSPYQIVSGNLRTKICDELLLKKSVKIIAGAHDTECCSLGSNIINTHDIVITSGTYEEIMVVKDRFNPTQNNFNNNVIIEEHILNNKYINYSVFFTGLLLEWIRKLFFTGLNGEVLINFEEIFTRLDDSITNILTIPYIKGTGSPDFDEERKAIIYGFDINSNKYEITKSFIESANFCIKRILYLLGYKYIKNIKIIGGGSKSDYLLKIKSDILNVDINSLEIIESGAYGAAMLACYANGTYKSFKELIKIFKNRIVKTIQPNINNVEIYNKKYILFNNNLDKL